MLLRIALFLFVVVVLILLVPRIMSRTPPPLLPRGALHRNSRCLPRKGGRVV